MGDTTIRTTTVCRARSEYNAPLTLASKPQALLSTAAELDARLWLTLVIHEVGRGGAGDGGCVCGAEERGGKQHGDTHSDDGGSGGAWWQTTLGQLGITVWMPLPTWVWWCGRGK